MKYLLPAVFGLLALAPGLALARDGVVPPAPPQETVQPAAGNPSGNPSPVHHASLSADKTRGLVSQVLSSLGGVYATGGGQPGLVNLQLDCDAALPCSGKAAVGRAQAAAYTYVVAMAPYEPDVARYFFAVSTYNRALPVMERTRAQFTFELSRDAPERQADELRVRPEGPELLDLRFRPGFDRD